MYKRNFAQIDQIVRLYIKLYIVYKLYIINIIPNNDSFFIIKYLKYFRFQLAWFFSLKILYYCNLYGKFLFIFYIYNLTDFLGTGDVK